MGLYFIAMSVFPTPLPDEVKGVIALVVFPIWLVLLGPSSAQRKWEEQNRIARGEPPPKPLSKEAQGRLYWFVIGVGIFVVTIVIALEADHPYSTFQMLITVAFAMLCAVFAYLGPLYFRQTLRYVGAFVGAALSYLVIVKAPSHASEFQLALVLLLPAPILHGLYGIWFRLPHVQKWLDKIDQEHLEAERRQQQEEADVVLKKQQEELRRHQEEQDAALEAKLAALKTRPSPPRTEESLSPEAQKLAAEINSFWKK